jgi:hypothetical protein
VEALRSHVVMLLVRRGTRTRDLVGAVEKLRQFGHAPDWLLYVASPRRLRKRMGETSGEEPTATAPSREEERPAAPTPS